MRLASQVCSLSESINISINQTCLGFNYPLNALSSHEKPNELAQAFHDILAAPPDVSIYRIIMDMVPQLDFFVSNTLIICALSGTSEPSSPIARRAYEKDQSSARDDAPDRQAAHPR